MFALRAQLTMRDPARELYTYRHQWPPVACPRSAKLLAAFNRLPNGLSRINRALTMSADLIWAICIISSCLRG